MPPPDHSPAEASGLRVDALQPLQVLYGRLEEDPGDLEVLTVLGEQLIDRGQPELLQALIRRARSASEGEPHPALEALARKAFVGADVVPAPRHPPREALPCLFLPLALLGVCLLSSALSHGVSQLPNRVNQAELDAQLAPLESPDWEARRDAVLWHMERGQELTYLEDDVQRKARHEAVAAALDPLALEEEDALQALSMAGRLKEVWAGRVWATLAAQALEHEDSRVRVAAAELLGRGYGGRHWKQGPHWSKPFLACWAAIVAAYEEHPETRAHLLGPLMSRLVKGPKLWKRRTSREKRKPKPVLPEVRDVGLIIASTFPAESGDPEQTRRHYKIHPRAALLIVLEASASPLPELARSSLAQYRVLLGYDFRPGTGGEWDPRLVTYVRAVLRSGGLAAGVASKPGLKMGLSEAAEVYLRIVRQEFRTYLKKQLRQAAQYRRKAKRVGRRSVSEANALLKRAVQADQNRLIPERKWVRPRGKRFDRLSLEVLETLRLREDDLGAMRVLEEGIARRRVLNRKLRLR